MKQKWTEIQEMDQITIMVDIFYLSQKPNINQTKEN